MKHSKGFAKPKSNDNPPGESRRLFSLAMQYQQANHLFQAETTYRKILDAQPGHLEALHNLGIVLGMLGNLSEAEVHLRKAAALQPDVAHVQYNLGNTLAAQENWLEAETSYRRAILCKPDLAEAHNNLGNALQTLERLDEAQTAFARAIALKPDFSEALNNLGSVLMKQKRPEEAQSHFRRAIALNPDLADAHHNLGCASMELAQRRTAAENLVEAEASFRRAIALRPDFAQAYNDLGNVLLEQARLEQDARGKLTEAQANYQRAIALKPDFVGAYNNLGNVLIEQGQIGVAGAFNCQALQLDPQHINGYYSHANLLLLTGNLRAGWQEYEWRWRTETMAFRSYRQPVWDGSDPAGKTILLWVEQGYGDAIQFIRYAPLVRARGATVVVECRAVEQALFRGCTGIERVVVEGETLPEFDLHVPLMSLPRLFETELETIPAQVPYLRAPEGCSLPETLRTRLLRTSGTKIGLVWSSKQIFFIDRKRHCPLEWFAPLIEMPGLSWFSLYKGEQTGDLKPYCDRVVDLGSHFLDFADTAWAIERLDLVITVDTAVAHLAGALGKPVWVLLPFVPDWRWLLEREDSPWYPTARLFRQTVPGKWGPPLAAVALALEEVGG